MSVANDHLFWITSRAAGTSAMVLASASVGYGLAMAGRIGRGNAARRRTIHEALALSVMVAIAIHGLSLLGDTFLHPSLLDITIPFMSGYQRLATSAGIIAGGGLIALGLSFYARARIGVKRWRAIHRFTLVAWVAALGHTFTEGTDAGTTWFIALIVLTALPALVALIVRAGGAALRSGPPHAAAAPRAARPAA